MENQLDQVRKTNPLPKFIVVAVGIFIVVCVLIGLGVFYAFGRPFFDPKSQIILEPDYSLVTTVDPVDLENAAQILTARTGITFGVAENNQIIAQVPTSFLSHNLVEEMIAVGLLEIVDFGETQPQQGTTIATDFGYKYFPPVEGTKRHTVITNNEFESADVTQDKGGNYQISFTLNANGTKILSDYTTNNVGHYLGIVWDKVVIAAPKINAPITDGRGIIAGRFTKEQAEYLVVVLHAKGPLPIPLKVKQISEIGK